MLIKDKLILFTAGFLVIILFLSLGSIYIFGKVSNNIELLQSVSEEHSVHEDLKRAVREYIEVVQQWALTSNPKYKRMFQVKREAALKSFGALDRYVINEEKLNEIGREFEEVDIIARSILKAKPGSESSFKKNLPQLSEYDLKIDALISQMDEMSIQHLKAVARRTDVSKDTVTTFLLIMIVLGGIAALSLITILKRSISDPITSIIEATDRISNGDLSYKVPVTSSDELGLLSERFNVMVDKVSSSDSALKYRLSETELLLDIAKIAGTATDIKAGFNIIVQIISERLNKDGCAIYVLDEDSGSLRKEASAGIYETSFNDEIIADDVIAKEALTHHRPLFLSGSDISKTSGLTGINGTMLSIPILVNGKMFGIMLTITNIEEDLDQDELNLFILISHTIGTAIRNVELYSGTKVQLKRISALYKLAQTLTDTITISELFKKVTEEMTRLLEARGCIIRLLEENKLPVKSSFGLSFEMEKEMELEIGDGIAGWVAENGKPLLVEDASHMPENMRVPVIDVKSVICVPMFIADRIIGTIGIYDKKDPLGNIISFDNDDLSTMEGFASLTSVAIDKAMSYERERDRERTVLEAKKRMEILFESVRGGIITINRDWKVILANRYIENWTDRRLDDIIGHNSLEIFHKANNPICPHCVAKATFETGEINTITQSRGINYAELSSYPIKDNKGNVSEAVVFIQDITDRVLYQEEILSLYKEVSQTKEYLESLIDNSADAIVTTDIEGNVTSWNKGAEKIYGFREDEAIGTFLPFLPEFLVETERKYIERLTEGETIKDIETVRLRKDGTMFEVSLTLSPIKDTSGEVIGITGISRDISEKKKVEKELIRRNQELSRLFFISSAMRGTLELEKLLRMVLTAVTMSDGLGFNRAMLFMTDEDKNSVKGVMGVGPASHEEAWQIWDKLSLEQKTLPEVLQEVEESPLKKDSFLDKLSTGIEVSLDEDTAIAKAVKEKKAINIIDVHQEPGSDNVIIQQTGTQAYVLIPLISRDRVTGVLWADNYFNRKPITDEDIRFLTGFADQVAAAIESARLFEQVKLAEAELENIFESISDMVYFNSKDYEIKSINKAVSDKIGLPPEEIIGQKCYKIFHGMDHPWEKCPHHKTVMKKEAFVEELEDPHLGGTFLVSSSPIFNQQDDFLGTVHVVRDITEQKLMREKLATADRMAALGEVAAKVAHEIRNPLVSIGGFSRRLEKKLEGDLKDYASVISKEVIRLERILREILGYVREVRLTHEPAFINDIIKDVLPLFMEEARKRKISISTTYGKKMSEIDVDINKIKEGLINLIGNALEAVPDNGKIKIKTYVKDNFSVTEISDTGHGIDKKDMPYLFDPFYTTKVAGTGLGLSITHRIVEQHKGKIEVESEEGKGTKFIIYLPSKEV
ncbi:MAG: PAS domain S-box protein [Nitrospirota bacterium]|nr:MAG: PAS domain S-box protein [Nitrospirota bacterium]